VSTSWPADITAPAVESLCSKGDLLEEGIKHLVPEVEEEEGWHLKVLETRKGGEADPHC